MDQEDFDVAPEVTEVLDDLDPNNPDNAFAILERNYNRIVSEMEEKADLQGYLDEFHKIFDYLYHTREEALRLASEKEMLAAEAYANEEQLKASKTTLRSEAQTIASLRVEIEKSHKLIDCAHIREQMAQEIIDNLRKQISNINAEIEFKTKLAQGDLEENKSVVKHREGLEREKLELLSKITKLDDKMAHALAYQEVLEKRTDHTDLQIVQVKSQLEETTSTMEKYKRSKENLEQALEEVKEELRQKNSEVESLIALIRNQCQLTDELGIDLKHRTDAAQKFEKDLQSCNKRQEKLKEVLDRLALETAIAKKENAIAQQDLRLKEGECQNLTVELSKLNCVNSQLEKKVDQLQNEKAIGVEEKNQLFQTIENIQMEVNTQHKQSNWDQRQLETLQWDKKVIIAHLEKQKAVNKANLKIIHAQGLTQKNLEIELANLKQENDKKHTEIAYLRKERDRLGLESQDKYNKIVNLTEDLKIEKAAIFRTEKEKSEVENKLRQQHIAIETLQSDHTDFQKAMREVAAESHNLRDKIMLQHYQNEGLKEVITAKEQLLIKHDAILRKVVKLKDATKIDLSNTVKQVETLKSEIKQCTQENTKLKTCLVNSEKIIKDQNQFLTKIIDERDILGFQLVRRNDELQLIYEKIKILQAVLQKGEVQYAQRLADIKLLKLEIKRLRQQKSFLTTSIQNMTDLKQEVFHLERDLIRERLKVKALEDELHNPMNVHRWRKLEGSDPQVFELLQKIRLLQKRILHQAGQMVDRERQLKEAETMYVSLRQMMAKQPGPEIMKRLNKAQDALSVSTTKIKCLIAELNMVEIQNKECNMHLKNTSIELSDVKRKLLTEKKQHAKNLEALRAVTKTHVPKKATSPSGAVKYTGGGFRICAI